jgi:NhaP-type Na+/H+ or K+/H+ antiporter
MNDGSAFPFVMLGLGLLGLHELGEFGLRWAVMDVLWATLAGVAIGVISGAGMAHLEMELRERPRGHDLMDDFLGLGLIATVYGVSVLLDAWGFLAVFFAAVALRQTERRLSRVRRHEEAQPQAGVLLPGDFGHPSHRWASPTVSEGSLVFKEHLGRLSELVLILLVGGSLFVNSWSWRAVGVALFLFLVARPVSVLVALSVSRTPWRIRAMAGWFGVRGIGSLYYLVYAIQHGLPEAQALELIHITLIVITLSILVHGISVKPALNRFCGRAQSGGYAYR